MNETLTAKALRGLRWTYLAAACVAVLQVLLTSIMARLLEPSAFGLVAMAGVILRFGSYFAQMGIGPAVIQKHELHPNEIRAAFAASTALGVLFSVLMWVIAPLSVLVFPSEGVVEIVRALGVSFVFTGVSTTSTALMRRNLEFRSLAIVEVLSFAIGYGAVGFVMAYTGFKVWSLVAASLSQNILVAVLAFAFQRHSLLPSLRWDDYKALSMFGSRVSIIGFLEFIGSSLDTLWIGHRWNAALLGLYNRAFMLVNLPMQYVTTSFSKVLLPSFSSIQKDTERLQRAYSSSLMLIAIILIPTCLGIAVASEEIVLVILGEQWIQAIPVLSILSIATIFNLLSHIAGVTCEATARLNVKILIQSVYVAVLLALFLVLNRWALLGIATAVVICEALRFLAFAAVISTQLGVGYRRLWGSILPGAIYGSMCATMIYAVSLALKPLELGPLTLLTSEVLVGLTLLVSLIGYGPYDSVRKEILLRVESSSIARNAPSVRILRFLLAKEIQ
jgi:O-antigen/teichoic acid export membrane protein